MGAFQTGFGFGMQAWNNAEQARDRQLARERQDKLDKIAIDAAERKAKLDDITLQELKQKQADEQGLRAAGSDLVGQDGFASGEQGQRIFSADKSVAEATAEINAAVNELSGQSPAPASEVQPAMGVTGGGQAPTIAAPGMKLDNSLGARVQRQAEYLTKIGQGKRAMELQTEFKDFENKLYDANRTAVFNSFAGALYNKGPEEAVRIYNAYNDGITAKYVPNADGIGGTIIRYKDGTDTEVDRIAFKSADDLALQVKRAMFPEQHLAAQEKASSETVTVKPGEEIYQGGKLKYKNNTPTSGEASLARALMTDSGFGGSGGSGGTGGARGGKPHETLSQQVVAAISAASKDADGAMRLSPQQLVQANAYGDMIANNNPAITVPIAADIAMKVSQDPSLIKPGISDSGVIGGVYQLQNGNDVLVSKLDPSRLPPETRQVLAVKAQERLLNASKNDPEAAKLMLLHAHGDKVAYQQMKDVFVPAAIDRIQRDPRYKDLSREQATDAAIRMFDMEMKKNRGLLESVRQLVPAPKREAPKFQPSAQPPQRPSQPQAATRSQPPAQPARQSTPAAGVDLSKSPTSMGMAYDTPEAKAALTERLRQASSGGTPLTRVELLRARQLGLTQ